MIKSKTQGAKNKVYKPQGASFYLTLLNFMNSSIGIILFSFTFSLSLLFIFFTIILKAFSQKTKKKIKILDIMRNLCIERVRS
jgi:preprotein translocase subunit SecG